MESPPFSTHSEAPPLSEDSGLIITSGSFSSDSASGWHHVVSEVSSLEIFFSSYLATLYPMKLEIVVFILCQNYFMSCFITLL